MYRAVFTPQDESQLTIVLPKECLNHRVEIISEDEIKVEPELSHAEKVERAFAVFDKYRVDTSGFKFDRDEANER
jgi:hypothetical protein